MQTVPVTLWSVVRAWMRHTTGWIRGFVYGAARTWIEVPYHLRRRAELERLWVVLMLSEQEGIPLAPPDLQLRLLPYLVPQILSWRRRPHLWDDELEVVHMPHMGH